MPLVRPFRGLAPRLAGDVFLAENATVVGEVELGAGVSVWYGAVLRGDVGPIRVGARTNLQDLCMVHLTGGLSVTTVGEECTVGHGVIIHGATVGHGVLVGMGSILLDNCVIGDECLIAAGSVVPPRLEVPPGMLVRGAPARVVRPVTDTERRMGREGAATYLELARDHAGGSAMRPKAGSPAQE